MRSKGEASACLAVGSEARFDIAIEVTRPLSYGLVAIMIITEDGVPVHTLWSGERLWSADVGDYILSAAVPELRLYPGHYTIDLWIGDAGSNRVDMIKSAASVVVAQFPDGGQPRALRRKHGLVVQESIWTAQKLDESKQSMSLQTH
jgi:hypothetical protein